MSRVVIAFDSSEGQTRKIAQRMGDLVRRSGHDVQAVDIRRLPPGFSLEQAGGILIGASIHMGKHSRRAAEFVRRYLVQRNAVPSAFFSVSLSAAGSDKERADADRYVQEFLRQTGWSPTLKATFAGGLLYREYGFLKRWMMKKIARDAGKDTDTSRNHEYTDWNAVEQFVSALLSHLASP